MSIEEWARRRYRRSASLRVFREDGPTPNQRMDQKLERGATSRHDLLQYSNALERAVHARAKAVSYASVAKRKKWYEEDLQGQEVEHYGKKAIYFPKNYPGCGLTTTATPQSPYWSDMDAAMKLMIQEKIAVDAKVGHFNLTFALEEDRHAST